MSEFTLYTNNDLEFQVQNKTGLCHANQNAIVRMFPNTPRATLQRRLESFKGSPKYNVINAEINTEGGIQWVALYPAAVVHKLALEFDLALAEKMGDAGANVYMLGLAGYKVSVQEANSLTQLPKPVLTDIRIKFNTLIDVYGKAYAVRWYESIDKKHYPELAAEMPSPEDKPSLPAAALLTPTQIAAELNIFYKTGKPNPQDVNVKLATLGYQIKIGGQWAATEKAIDLNLCDRKPVDTASKTQRDQLLWSSDIINILRSTI